MLRGAHIARGLGAACLLSELLRFSRASPAGPPAPTDAPPQTSTPSGVTASRLNAPAQNKRTAPSPPQSSYDYDVVVIGGGSGGIACAREAARKTGLGVALLDWVSPSPAGTTWGLGGTCVNVGCIPKKIFRHAAELGAGVAEASDFGWGVAAASSASPSIDWQRLTDVVSSHISSLNWSYRTSLRADGVTYINGRGRLLDPHTVAIEGAKRAPAAVTARHVVIATGGRPTLPAHIPGAREYCHTSDDIFSLPRAPGKTLVVGGGYVALETAGLLAGLGFPVTLAIRGKALRGFDEEAAELVVADLARRGVRVVTGLQVGRVDKREGEGLLVTYTGSSSSGAAAVSPPQPEVFDTVLFAVGRTPATASLGLDAAGVATDPSGKLLCHASSTPSPLSATSVSCPSVHGVGDVVAGRPELTPVAIAEGRALGRRLAAAVTAEHGTASPPPSSAPAPAASVRPLLPPVDYRYVPTTVFTPLPYACVGMSEAQALQAAASSRGTTTVEVYRTAFATLEQAAAKKAQLAAALAAEAAGGGSCSAPPPSSAPLPDAPCFMKVVTLKRSEDDEEVAGLHLLGPGAAEAVQGLALALKTAAAAGGLQKADLDAAIGVHPTFTEEVFNVTVTKSSGAPYDKTEC